MPELIAEIDSIISELNGMADAARQACIAADKMRVALIVIRNRVHDVRKECQKRGVW